MSNPAPFVDVAALALYTFFGFFAALVVWLRREDRREGYPLEDDLTGRLEPDGGLLFFGAAKVFNLPFGRGEVVTPRRDRDPFPENIVPAQRAYPGTPFDPAGDPLSSGVGPGAWARRADLPDLNFEGHPRIVPMRVEPGITVDDGCIDPRGLPVTGADKIIAGTVRDMWIDRADHLVRYYEVELTGGGTAMLPYTMSVVGGMPRHVNTDSITAAQFAGAPQPKAADQITLLEEDKIQAYFGAGYLWATPARSEPLL